MEKIKAEEARQELTMLLIWLNRMCDVKEDFNTTENFITWKNYDYGVLSELERRGFIYNGEHPGRRKTLDICPEGIKEAKRILEKYGIEDWPLKERKKKKN